MDQAERKPGDDPPEPTAEPDAGAAPGASGSGLAASEKAQNAETVLDPDSEPEDPAGVGDQIDRLERHSRQTTSPAYHESRPQPDTPPA